MCCTIYLIDYHSTGVKPVALDIRLDIRSTKSNDKKKSFRFAEKSKRQ